MAETETAAAETDTVVPVAMSACRITTTEAVRHRCGARVAEVVSDAEVNDEAVRRLTTFRQDASVEALYQSLLTQSRALPDPTRVVVLLVRQFRPLRLVARMVRGVSDQEMAPPRPPQGADRTRGREDRPKG